MPRLSVILPIFNGKKSLNKCIDSIINQKYTDFELICIDDESTDNSYDICEQYSVIDKRINIYKRTNGGVAAARNTGLKHASGEFVTFVDQDDWIEKEMYYDLLNKMDLMRVDCGVCGFYKESKNVSEKMINKGFISSEITDVNQFIRFAFYREQYRNYAAYVWNKVFSHDILINNAFGFDEDIRRGDDVLFYTWYAMHSKSVAYVKKHYYHYSINDSSVTNTRTKANLSVLDDILIGYEKAIGLLVKDSRIKKETIDYLRCFYTYHAIRLYEICERENLLEEKEYFRTEIRRYYEEYEKQNKEYPERLQYIKTLL